jgi:membrane fusion protein (multidrug efflux system)
MANGQAAVTLLCCIFESHAVSSFMANKIVYSVVAVLGIGAASTAAWWYQNKQPSSAPVAAGGPPAQGGAAGAPRAVGVEVARVDKLTLRDDAQAVGTLRSRQNVMLRPEVAGRIMTLGFSDGSPVQAGQTLVQLDDTLQRAEVQQSLAQVSIAQANHKRNQELVAQNFVAQRVLDESAASLQVAQAQLALSCARLDRMRILAPFPGVVGIRTVNIGDYVKDGTDLINLEDISVLYVDFRLPERYQGKIVPRQIVELQLDALPGRMFKAQVEAIDPLIDANGRSIGVRAVLPNQAGEPVRGAGGGAAAAPAVLAAAGARSAAPAVARAVAAAPAFPGDIKPGATAPGCPEPRAIISPAKGQGSGPLRPGMFARVTAVFEVRPDALSVPEEAIVPQGGRQFVIRAVSPSQVASTAPLPPDVQQVSQRVEVKLGIRRPGRVEILEGLAEGDTVVIAGQQRLQKDGTPLRTVEMSRGASGGAAGAAGGPAGNAAPAAAPGAAPTAAPTPSPAR